MFALLTKPKETINQIEVDQSSRTHIKTQATRPPQNNEKFFSKNRNFQETQTWE